ncbi:MAG: dihydrodipicolinate synthase family protein [Candidatus Dormibacteria bacterium]
MTTATASGAPATAWTSTFSGLIVATVTPMHQERSIDLEAIDPYVEFLLQRGADALMVLGTTGEFITMTPDERGLVQRRFVAAVAGRVPVIVHVGHVDLRIARALGASAVEDGADAIASITPYYHHFTPSAIEEHQRQLARAFPDCPFFVYNYPDAAGNRIEFESFQRLLQEPNVRAVKLSVATWEEVEPFLQSPKEVLVTCGNDSFMERFMAVGGRASVSGNAAAFPDALALARVAFRSSDPGAQVLAREVIARVVSLSLAGASDRLKDVLEARGVSVGPGRIRSFIEADLPSGRVAELEELIATLGARVGGGGA